MSLGLYVHFPFCPYLCNYCDYFKVLYNGELEESFFRALTAETRLVQKENPQNLKIDTLYIGGGTPSIAKLELFEKWLKTARELFEFSDNLEFSIECNIDSIDIDKMSALKEMGVTRPSFGMQSFHKQMLEILTRPHDERISQQVNYHAHVLGFNSFNVDLLFGIPNQTNRIFNADMGQLVDMEPPHISLYELVVESNTPLAESIENGKLTLPEETQIAAMQSSASELLTDNGYTHYEISSFARPGKECRHNLNYWQGGEYIGLGPSANSYLRGKSHSNLENVGEYIDILAKNELPQAHSESDLLHHAENTIRSGLRMKQGINKDKFLELFGVPLENRINKRELETFFKHELLTDEDGYLKTTETGFFKADEIARRLLD